MAIKELFYDNRPQVLLDPKASQRIDPRFNYTRNSTASYYDKDGIIKTAAVGQPRFGYHPITGEFLGLQLEPAGENLTTNSATNFAPVGSGAPTITTISAVRPDGTTGSVSQVVYPPGIVDARVRIQVTSTPGTYVFSCYIKKLGDGETRWFRMYGVSARDSFVYFDFNPGSVRHPFYSSIPTTLPGSSLTYLYTFAQIERVTNGRPAISSSYIPTGGSAVTRAADILSIEAPLPTNGSVYIDARAISTTQNDTLLSLKNASNDKIDLAYLSNASTYNSLALIANYDGTSKSSLPLPVPTTARERNIITWGANNYQYGRDSSRYATSLSSSVPTGLNTLSIGHDAVDPTKAFNGYINTVYCWSGELTPTVAEALVRNEVAPINADTYSPVGPAGALSLVINTQGATTTGGTTFTLPANRASYAATALVAGQTYRILTVGTTNFTLIGAASNTVGVVFTATGAGTGTGTAAYQNDLVITWGDGTESGLDGTDAEAGAAALTHTYNAAGIYPVWVSGRMQNIYYNNDSNAPDVLSVERWGTGTDGALVKPTTMNGAFYGCSQMNFSSTARTTSLPDTSAVTDWTNAFYGCAAITSTFPSLNLSAATNLTSAWRGCSGMTSFIAAGDQTINVTNFSSAWYGCSGLTSFPQINTTAGTNFSSAWYGCSGLTSFPLINTAAGTDFNNAWNGCSGLTSFPVVNTTAGTNFSYAWQNCVGLTSFPLINTTAGTNFSYAWYGCSSLTSFPLINTAAGTNFSAAWYGCSGLTSFPLLDTSKALTLQTSWYACSSLTSFPLINTSLCTNFIFTWQNCYSLTSFPLIDTSKATTLRGAWVNCASLTSFPALNTALCTSFESAWQGCTGLTSFPPLSAGLVTGAIAAWRNCTGLTSFPAIDMPLATNIYQAWNSCTSLTSFPLINLNSVTNASQAWISCSSLTSFPAIVMSSVTGLASESSTIFDGFRDTWRSCTNLASFPASMFNTTTCTRFLDAFRDCALTAASIENIIVSINTANTSNGNLSLQGGTNAGASTWTANAVTAYNALIARGWTITRNA